MAVDAAVAHSAVSHDTVASSSGMGLGRQLRQSAPPGSDFAAEQSLWGYLSSSAGSGSTVTAPAVYLGMCSSALRRFFAVLNGKDAKSAKE